MPNAKIEYCTPASLTPYTRNARTHSKKQLKQIVASIETFGFTNPILIDQSGTILAGHGRVAAAKMMGLQEVPCLRIEHMSQEQKRAYVIADNKLALNAGWDEDILAQELSALLEIPDLEFDIDVIGFDTAEVDSLIEAVHPQEDGDPKDELMPKDATRRVNTGDIWLLGNHKLICGDALDPGVLMKLMDGEVARMIFTDPPYNVKIDGHVGNHGKIKHREFAMASGEMSAQDFTAFLATALQNMADHAMDGSIHFVCMDWRHMSELMQAGGEVYTELKNLIVWAKDNGGMGSFYRSRHDLIFAFKKGTAPHVNSFELGQHGRYRTNVWNYRGVNTIGAERMKELMLHPTVKPVQMIADAIRDVSSRGDIVLDAFGGSGSSLIAAHKTGRVARLVELDEMYCYAVGGICQGYGDTASLWLDATCAIAPD